MRRQDPTTPISVYDSSGQLLKVLGVGIKGITGHGCRGIAVDTNRDVYIITMADGSLVTMDTHGGCIQVTYKVRDKRFHGVCYSDLDLYITTQDKFGSCQIFLLDPKHRQNIRSFTPESYIKQITCFACGNVTIDDHTRPVIMVTDSSSVCVKLLDYNGHLIHTYLGLSSPSGVCTDSAGHMIVCNQMANQVVSIGPKGNRNSTEVLVTGDLVQPIYVSCLHDSRILFVGCNNGVVHIYQG